MKRIRIEMDVGVAEQFFLSVLDFCLKVDEAILLRCGKDMRDVALIPLGRGSPDRGTVKKP